MAETVDDECHALQVLYKSYSWYESAAKKSRMFHRVTEVMQLLASAAIPLSAVLIKGNTTIPAIFGAAIVIIAGLRAMFHWQEDYLRFSRARELVEAERRLFITGADPYGNSESSDQILVRRITEIEQQEMGVWLSIAGPRRNGGAAELAGPASPLL
jgi:hypothetical protein